jgi:hypothetical protein
MPRKFDFLLKVPSQHQGACINFFGREGRTLSATPLEFSGGQIKVSLTVPFLAKREKIVKGAVRCLLAFSEIPDLVPQTELWIDNASISLSDTDEDFLLNLFSQSSPRQASQMIDQRQKHLARVVAGAFEGVSGPKQRDQHVGIRYDVTLKGSTSDEFPQQVYQSGTETLYNEALPDPSTDSKKVAPPSQVRSSDVSTVQQPEAARRFLQGRFPRSVRTRDRATLQVRVARELGHDSSASLKCFDIPPEGADILLVLYCPGFKVLEKTQAHVVVHADSDSDWAAFELEALEPGVHNMEVNAFGPGGFIGTLPIQVTVANQVDQTTLVDHTADAHVRPSAPGEFTLLIRYDRAAKVYRYQFIEGNLAVSDEISSLPLMSGPEDEVNTMIGQLNSLARGKIPYDTAQTRAFLKGLGINLWNGMIPNDLKNLFWDRRSQIKRIVIQSAGDLIPWEILYPYSSTAGDFGFLSEKIPVTRWTFGRPPASRLSFLQSRFVLPAASPATAASEVSSLSNLVGSQSKPVAELSELLDLLNTSSFNLLHFACHNTFRFDSPLLSSIMLGNLPFQPTFLASLHLREQDPLVFMNACRTAGEAPSYTRLGGWATSFVAAGAGAFVGSQWEVRDDSASSFAECFYQGLRNKLTLGEAALKARNSIADRPGDPTWLAYSVYGDPSATLP